MTSKLRVYRGGTGRGWIVQDSYGLLFQWRETWQQAIDSLPWCIAEAARRKAGYDAEVARRAATKR